MTHVLWPFPQRSVRAAHTLHTVTLDPGFQRFNSVGSSFDVVQRVLWIIGLHSGDPGVFIGIDVNQVWVLQQRFIPCYDLTGKWHWYAARPFTTFQCGHMPSGIQMGAGFFNPGLL